MRKFSTTPRLRWFRLEPRVAPAVASFRATAVDVEIRSEPPGWSDPTAASWQVSGSPSARQVLLRFNDLFGSGPGKIPAGAEILQASLTVWVEAAGTPGSAITFHRMYVPWSETATWSSFGGHGVPFDDQIAAPAPIAEVAWSSAGYQIVGGLAPSVRSWAQGDPVMGWVVSSDAATPWTVSSSESTAADRRPTLAVMYRPVTPTGMSYAQLAGQPPSPLELAWFDWADDLRERRIERVPSQRTQTFYFAQSGDDLHGRGTFDSPWRSLAKAQEVLDGSAGDVRLRFRRGDVWREDRSLQVVRDQVTVDDYGDAAMASPRFTRFVRQYFDHWVPSAGGAFRRDEPFPVGWVREGWDGYYRIYYRAASAAEVASRPYSWFHDPNGTDPLSGGQPSLFVNANGLPSLVPGGLEACNSDGMGWVVFADNVRMQNLTLEGQGVVPHGLGYGLKIVHAGAYWEFVGIGLNVYYTGYHAIGQIGQYQGTKSIVTLVNCSAGWCVNNNGQNFLNSGDITVFVSYADWGFNEYVQYGCEYAAGALPSADWAAPIVGGHGQGLYVHVGLGGLMELMLIQKTRFRPGPQAVRSLANLDNVKIAGQLNQVRSYIVEDPSAGRVTSVFGKPFVAVINSAIDQRSPPPPYNMYHSAIYSGFGLLGWMINCTISIDLSFQFNFDYTALASPLPISMQLIHCHVDLFNSQRPMYFIPESVNAAGFAPNARLINSIVSFQTNLMTGLNLVNSPNNILHNAYFLPQLRPEARFRYDNDPGAVTLTGRYPAGVRPFSGGPVFDGGSPFGLQYDADRRPRGLRVSIGPLDGVDVPEPHSATVGWGTRTTTLGEGAVLPWATVRRFTVSYPTAVPIDTANSWLSDSAGKVRWFSHVTADGPTYTFTSPNNLADGTYRLVVGGAIVRTFTVRAGDFNADGSVNFLDFLMFRTGFGGTQAEFDLDGDGNVDFNDFLRFRTRFNT